MAVKRSLDDIIAMTSDRFFKEKELSDEDYGRPKLVIQCDCQLCTNPILSKDYIDKIVESLSISYADIKQWKIGGYIWLLYQLSFVELPKSSLKFLEALMWSEGRPKIILKTVGHKIMRVYKEPMSRTFIEKHFDGGIKKQEMNFLERVTAAKQVKLFTNNKYNVVFDSGVIEQVCPYKTMCITSKDLHELLVHWPKDKAKNTLAIVALMKNKPRMVVRVHYKAHKCLREIKKGSAIYAHREIINECYKYCKVIAQALMQYTELKLLEMIAEFSIGEDEVYFTNAWQVIYHSFREESQRKVQIEMIQNLQVHSVFKQTLLNRLDNEEGKKPEYLEELTNIIGHTIETFKQKEGEDPDEYFIKVKSKEAFDKLRPNNKFGLELTINNEIHKRFTKGSFS